MLKPRSCIQASERFDFYADFGARFCFVGRPRHVERKMKKAIQVTPAGDLCLVAGAGEATQESGLVEPC